MFRILSLDGGGIRGAFIAACLARLEREIEVPITNYFDLIAGTSTGGVIALALALGESAERILSLYTTHGVEIFTRRKNTNVPFWMHAALRMVRRQFPIDEDAILRSKYPQQPLRDALYAVYGDRTLGDINTCRVVITAVDLILGRTTTFKTAHQPNFIRDRHRRAVDVALATTAAPSFFPHATIETGTAFSDGGLWANNPAIVGYAEAVKISHLEPRPDIDQPFTQEDIHMLSIGTGKPQYYARPSNEEDGLLWWGPRLFDVSGGAQSQGVDFQARYLMGESRYTRIDFEMPTQPWALDDIAVLSDLVHLGEQTAVDNYASIRDRFLVNEKQPFQPYD